MYFCVFKNYVIKIYLIQKQKKEAPLSVWLMLKLVKMIFFSELICFEMYSNFVHTKLNA